MTDAPAPSSPPDLSRNSNTLTKWHTWLNVGKPCVHCVQRKGRSSLNKISSKVLMEFIIYPRTLSIMCNTVYYQVQRLQDLRGARNDGHYLSSSKFRTATSPWINNKIKAVSLTFFRLSLELLSRIFTFHFLTGVVKSVAKLGRLSTQLRLVRRQWDAVIVSTPSLRQLQLDGRFDIPPTY